MRHSASELDELIGLARDTGGVWGLLLLDLIFAAVILLALCGHQPNGK